MCPKAASSATEVAFEIPLKPTLENDRARGWREAARETNKDTGGR